MAKEILFVPIKLDAFLSDSNTKLAKPLADFTKLPYLYHSTQPATATQAVPSSVGWPPPTRPSCTEVNTDQAFLGSTVFRGPQPSFAGADATWTPPPGLHLHWALPDALTSQRVDPASEGQSRFPQVPNRWLIVLSTRESGAWAHSAAWVVESDYLHAPPGTNPVSCGPEAISFPIAPPAAFKQILEAPERPSAQHPSASDISEYPFFYQAPFRCMGRNAELTAWQADNAKHEYLSDYNPAGLTAVGYGHPLFAAIYSNCFSVFGFHDSLANSVYPRRYDLIGWYDDADTDCLSLFQGLPAGTDPWASLKAEYDWVADASGTDLPAQSVYYARLEIDSALTGSLPESAAVLSVGNTATEALSAYLASILETDSGRQNVVEEQLEAIGLQPKIGVENIDLGAKFMQARHDKGFKKIHGGSLWSVRARSTALKATAPDRDQDSEVVLPDGLAKLLNQLNVLQAAYDASWDEIDALRRRAFTDWYRLEYKRVAAAGTGPQLPDINDILNYSVASALTPLEDAVGHTGQVAYGKDSAGNASVTMQDAGSQYDVTAQFSLAMQLVNAFDTVAQRLADYNTGAGAQAAALTYYIVRKGAPRFYQAADPAVLLAGKAVCATERYGTGELVCTPLDAAVGASGLTGALRSSGLASGPFSAILSQIDSLARAGNGFTAQVTQPWNPVSLEWSAQVWPETRNTSPGVSGEGVAYAPDYLGGTYELDVNAADLGLSQRPYGLANPDALYKYSGRAILVSHAPARMQDAVGAYLVPLSLADLKLGGLRDQTIGAEVDYDYDKALFSWANTVFGIPLPPFLASLRDPSTLQSQQILEQQNQVATWLQAQYPFAKQADGKTVLIDLGVLASGPAGWCDTRPVIMDDGSLGAFASLVPAAMTNDPVRTAVLAYNSVTSTPLLSQALSGFNDAMLTQQREFHLPVWDYRVVNLDGQQEYARDLTHNIGDIRIGPLFDGTFLPFRSGLMQITALTLVDSFGQYLELDYGGVGAPLKSAQMTILNNLAASVSSPASIATADENQHHIYLSPRLCQKARLNLRWLAAQLGDAAGQGDEQEMNDHPDTTPVCGWVLPNNLDQSLAIYDAQGRALGSLLQSDAGKTLAVVWEPAPGTNDSVLPSQISNPHLQDFVANIMAWGGQPQAPWAGFLSNINLALQNIDPEGFSQNAGLSLLIGRPMALVRAAMSLQVQGLPAEDHTLQAFNYNQSNGHYNRLTNGFDDVAVPVRLGAAKQLNDGLVSYWVENGDGSYSGDAPHFPELESSGTATDALPLTVSGDAVKLTMLVDPRGAVHASCGILPVKEITLPPDQYAAVLRSLSVTFLTAPVLTPCSRVDLLLPSESAYGWSWLDRPTGFTWNRVADIGAASREARYERQRILEGWLKLTPQTKKESD